MYSKVNEEKVWNGWRQMSNYLTNIVTVFSKGSSKYYYDQKGKKYFDATSNMLSSSLGHSIPEIKESIVEQYEQLDACSLLYETSDISIRYTEELLKHFEGRYEHIFFTNSGSDSCDTAIKVAQHYFHNKGLKEKRKIITLDGAYHGSSIAATLISSDKYDKRALKWGNVPALHIVPPRQRECPSHFTLVEWINHCVKEAKALIEKEDAKTIAAIIVEPVQLSNSVAIIPTEYFVKLKYLCEKYNILFIVDEVATGFGRTGKMFAFERWGVYPNMVMIAKAITNGTIPLGGVIVTSDIYNMFYGSMDSQKELSHGYTVSGNPIGCAAAYATLRYLEEHQVINNVELLEEFFIKELEKLSCYSFVESSEGIGFMFGIKFKNVTISQYNDIEVGAFIEGIMKGKGILVYYEGFQKMFIAPPLTSTKEELVYLMKILSRVFSLVDNLYKIY